MDTKLSHILQQTIESYRNVNPGLDGRGNGWHQWYAHWLLTISDIRDYLGVEPTEATLGKLLLKADSIYAITPTTKSWAQFAASEILLIVARYRQAQHGGGPTSSRQSEHRE